MTGIFPLATPAGTDCQGSWSNERVLGETNIVVLTCSECRLKWALIEINSTTKHAGFFTHNATDMDIVRTIIEDMYSTGEENS